MNKPNFFVVGAPKAGTTSIYRYLKNHPQVFVPKIKELHFFSYPEVTDTYYKVYFCKTLEEYLSFYISANNVKIIGDFSPSYLYNEPAAYRIKEFNPSAKILIMLRDPVRRAMSHYLMDLRLGYQDRDLKEFLVKTKENRLFYKEYIEMGFYYRQVKRYIDLFGNNVLILFLEDFKKNFKESLSKLFDFLEIEHIEINKEVYNKFSGIPKNKVGKFLEQNRFGKRIINKGYKFFPSITKRILNLFYIMEKPSFDDVKERLRMIYEEDVKKLSELIKVDCQKKWWKN